jgi:hypothetical protein
MQKTRLFFSTDIHGSETCFLKFLNAGEAYKADVLIMGGDITGKMIVPVVEGRDGSFSVEFLGEKYELRREGEIESLEKKIRGVGYYPYRVDSSGLEELSDRTKFDKIFSQLMCKRIRKWVDIADERLENSGIKCFMSPGNDDSFDIDAVFKKSKHVIYPEGKVVNIDSSHEMISCGFSNITPWRCPRDIPEEELAKKIEKMASEVKDMKNCIFNMHCPPSNTLIDQAPKLDKDMKPVLVPGGDYEMISVGSIAVREAIEEYQPLLSLHGHIHEARGIFKIGRTLCTNPGSEYTEGILRGFLIDISPRGIIDYILTSG